MEPIRINIEVGLNQPTLEALGRLLGAAQPAQAPAPAPAKPKKVETKKEPAPAPAPAPAEDDLPADDAPDPAPAEPQACPTDSEVRAVVKETTGRGVSGKAVRTLLKEKFGISSSPECPAERRNELIAELRKMTA